MGREHVVQQGEFLSDIAAQYGFARYETIWDHPDNARLKQERKNPNVLFPGDILYIPEKDLREEACGTEQRHVFLLHAQPCVLRIVSKDLDGEPIAETECTLQVEAEQHELTTDANGMVEQAIPKTARRGRLQIRNVEVPIQIGHLDPVEKDSGQQARLNNLGYYAGPLGDIEERELKSAIEEFQCDQELVVDGKCGPVTQKKLVEAHGC